MTRSIFDPTGPDTEHSGNRNLGPDAANGSHMPPDVTDGQVSEQEVRDVAGPDVAIPDENPATEAIAEAADAADRSDDPDRPTFRRADDLSNPGTEAKAPAST
jgi:hypothetical protein